MFDTPTQLEDVANKVAQQKIGDRRLRNEEIRRGMNEDWTAPTQTTGSQPSSLQDVYSNNGNSPTEASTYSRLKNNLDYMGFGGSNTSSNSPTESYNTSFNSIPSWGAQAVGMGMGLGGLGNVAGIGSAATSLLRGDTSKAAGSLGQWFANQTPIGKLPGASGAIGSTLQGILDGRDASSMTKNAAWNLGMGAIGKAVPGFGLLNTLLGLGTAGYAEATGTSYNWNPLRGIESLFSDTDSRGQTGGGFFTSPTPMSGEATTNNTYSGSGYGNTYGPGSGGYTPPSGSYMSSGNTSGYSPYGGSQNTNSGD